MVDARAAIAIIGLFLVAPRAGIGQVKASLAKVDFGAVAVGSTATASVTLTADEDLPRFSLELEAPFGLLVPPPPSLYASHPMTIWLTFTPTSQSAFHSVLELGGLKIELLGTGFGGTRATATGAPAAVRAAAGTPRPAGGLVFGNAAAAAATGIAQPAAAGLAVDAATRTIILGRGQQSGTATVTVSDVLGVAIGSVAAPAPVADVFSVSSTCPNHPADATTCTITATAT
ncbi:MAG: hypothetical protein ACRD1L_09930, partial [Terriglobales bacterium]